jgi:hypothetical protein
MTTKTSAQLTLQARQELPKKVFAIPKGEGPGGTGKYPIHDEAHARSALSFVRRHGTPEEQSKVYSAVAKRYPGLAARSSIEGVQKKVKTSAPIGLIRKFAQARDFEYIIAGPLPSTEDVILEMKIAAVADPEILAAAYTLAGGDPAQAIRDYELFGGTYKQAFGNPMFNTQQMAGSPAVSGGMQQRVTDTPSMQPQQPQQSQPSGTKATPAATSRASTAASAPSAPTNSAAPSVSVTTAA